ncbi:DUF4435 domain-containing protein [Gelidibacter japonicus]|uniref:DUF4435 domain-containing protein n=1 Tax=Gelidibacter japonicus TaxID=1962232 RepID=UPI003A905C18
MNSLEYSQAAEEAKGLFYNKDFTVYVEGDDDVMFWTHLFDLAEIDAHIEEVGGNEEIVKKIKEILDNNATFIVACDSDHSDFIEPISHDRIIKTYGYSIENSMYSPLNIQKVVRNVGKKPVSIEEEIGKWAESFSNNLYGLLIYDIANHVYDKGIQVFGNNCQRFLKSGTSREVCNTQVSNYLENIKKHFTEAEINEVKEKLSKSKKDIWFHLKGHFITNGIINLIQHHVKQINGTKCNISHDSLYALTIDCTEKWNSRVDINTIISKIKKIK